MLYRKFKISYIALIITIFPFIINILSLLNSKNAPVSTILQEIFTSLNSKPLINLEYSEFCSGSLSLYYFHGTQIGCSCINVDYYPYNQEDGQYIVNQGGCSINQTKNGCTDLDGLYGFDLQYWGTGKFCTKNYQLNSDLQTYFYLLYNSVSQNENCKYGFKKCGKLDDMGNFLCFPNNLDCPINFISKGLNYSQSHNDYISIGINNLYYTNITNEPVIIHLKVFEEKICMDRSYIYTKYPQYILDRNFINYGCRHKINGKLYEDIKSVLDSKTKKEFFDDYYLYDILNFYKNSDYEYPFYSLNAKMNLYALRYVGFDKKCLLKNNGFNAFDEEKIKKRDGIIYDIIYLNEFLLWVSSISLIISTMCISILNLEKEDTYIFIIIWLILNLFFCIAMGVPIIYAFLQSRKLQGLPLCCNDRMNGKIKFYNDNNKKIKIISYLSFFSYIIYFVFIIILVIIRCKFQYVNRNGPDINVALANINNNNLNENNDDNKLLKKDEDDDKNLYFNSINENRSSAIDDYSPRRGINIPDYYDNYNEEENKINSSTY